MTSRVIDHKSADSGAKVSALVVEYDKATGPALGDDLIAAGLNEGVCFQVVGGKTLLILSGVAKANRAAIEAVIAAHDAQKPKAPVPADDKEIAVSIDDGSDLEVTP